MRWTSWGSERSTTKSSPRSMNACTGDGGPWPSRSRSTARTLLEVVSGFCSEPESRVGQPAHALGVQPRALLAGAERDVGLRPAARPRVLGTVEAGRPEPVLQRELVG